MKKVLVTICLGWAFLGVTGVHGSPIQPWPEIGKDFKEEFGGELIEECLQVLNRESEEAELFGTYGDSQGNDIYGDLSVKEYIEVFNRTETARTPGSFSRGDKQVIDSILKPIEDKAVFLKSSEQQIGIEEPSLQWLVFVAGLSFLGGLLMFKSVPKAPGVFLIIIWIFFWQMIVRAVIVIMSFIDAFTHGI